MSWLILLWVCVIITFVILGSVSDHTKPSCTDRCPCKQFGDENEHNNTK